MQLRPAAGTDSTLNAAGSSASYDAVVVGSGPNGLSAAIELAREGASVLLIEAEESIGGGTRTRELTLPGYRHDVCSAIHPLLLASPFLSKLPLHDYGLEVIHPRAPLAHPLDGGRAAMLYRSLDETAENLGADGATYNKLMGPTVEGWEKISPLVLGPLKVPRHPIRLGLFGLRGIESAMSLVNGKFRDDQARALIAGIAAHSMLRLDERPTAGFALVLAALAHSFGWPLVRGGSNEISKALAAHFQSLGGTISTGWTVKSIEELPPHRVALFDITPAQLLRIAGDRLPRPYRSRLKKFRYGPGVFKIDWALDGPVPWTAAECSEAATVHVAGTAEEVASSEAAVVRRNARPRGQTHTLGVLPCAAWINSRHDRQDRGTDRALRTRIPRARAGAAHHERGSVGELQRKLRWRGHQRRPAGHAPALHAPGMAFESIYDGIQGHIHLLLVDASRRGRPRHVRLLGRPCRSPPEPARSPARRFAQQVDARNHPCTESGSNQLTYRIWFAR